MKEEEDHEVNEEEEEYDKDGDAIGTVVTVVDMIEVVGNIPYKGINGNNK